MRISAIEIKNLLPFVSSQVEFPVCDSRGKLGEVHLFTGPNGTGKSRLLSILAASTNFQGRCRMDRFPSGLHSNPKGDGEGNSVRVTGADNIICNVFCDEINPLAFAFSGAIQLQNSSIKVLKKTILPGIDQRISFNGWSAEDLNQQIANLKVQAAMELMNSVLDASGRSLSITRRLEDAVSEITGRKFAVVAQSRPEPKLLFIWGNRTLPIDSLPAGLSGVISWLFAAATVMDIHFTDSQDPLAEEALFFLDEPETYLHPEWQRKILPMAQRLFPNSQFFVATHSPFVVSSLNEGFIYKLTPDESGEVEISKAILASKGDSYITAVSEILGLSEWFDPESEKLLAKFRTERDAALKGNPDSQQKARVLAEEISQRSQELANIIGMEMRQFERLMEKQPAAATA